jgi:hypothetical protein
MTPMNAAETQEKNKRISEIQDVRDYASGAISTQTRTTSLGVLAITWLLLSGTEKSLTEKFDIYSNSLLLVAAICIIAIALDFCQYIFSFLVVSDALKDSLQAKKLDSVGFNTSSTLHKLTNYFFFLKIVAASIATIVLLIVMFRALLH